MDTDNLYSESFYLKTPNMQSNCIYSVEKNGSFVSLVHEDVQTKCFCNPLSVLNRQATLVVVCFF